MLDYGAILELMFAPCAQRARGHPSQALHLCRHAYCALQVHGARLLQPQQLTSALTVQRGFGRVVLVPTLLLHVSHVRLDPSVARPGLLNALHASRIA